jgi:tRNA pseudouridine55 synthase
LAPRRVEVLAAELVGLYSDLGAAERELPKELASQPRLPPALGRFPTLLVRYQVSSGTYVRVLAADLAARLGTTAHLGGLVRLRSGQVGLEQAQLLEDFHPERALSPAAALGMDTLQLSAAQAESLRRGLQVAASRSGVFLAYGPEGLIGIVQGDGYQLRPLRNWPISSE